MSKTILIFLDKFKWIIITFLTIWIIGLVGSIFTNKHQKDIESVMETVGSHVRSIAIDEWIKTNSDGSQYESYIFANSGLNISLFYDNFSKMKNIYGEASTDSKLKWTDKSKFIKYYKTIYFFTLWEMIDRAYNTNDSDALEKYWNELDGIKNDRFIWESIDGSVFEQYLINFRKLKAHSELGVEMDKLSKDIDYCDISCSAEEYNALVKQYNALLPDYNSNSHIGDEFFKNTLQLIDISILFPTWDHSWDDSLWNWSAASKWRVR